MHPIVKGDLTRSVRRAELIKSFSLLSSADVCNECRRAALEVHNTISNTLGWINTNAKYIWHLSLSLIKSISFQPAVKSISTRKRTKCFVSVKEAVKQHGNLWHWNACCACAKVLN